VKLSPESVFCRARGQRSVFHKSIPFFAHSISSTIIILARVYKRTVKYTRKSSNSVFFFFFFYTSNTTTRRRATEIIKTILVQSLSKIIKNSTLSATHNRLKPDTCPTGPTVVHTSNNNSDNRIRSGSQSSRSTRLIFPGSHNVDDTRERSSYGCIESSSDAHANSYSAERLSRLTRVK